VFPCDASDAKYASGAASTQPIRVVLHLCDISTCACDSNMHSPGAASYVRCKKSIG
jgi:hypothetical protein